ncbi:MAG TPA: type I glyceraldehyde-3-phosphate dehydrogenase [Candidatus Kapabacteria bacterium]|nr:type I glyceraldehyde-3-phosphate dehydrogenase [Candidatus Kapabacteria bacterium]
MRVAINGFGRIGRHALKAGWEKKGMEIVAINDLTDTKTLAHLLKYDTAYPDFAHKVTSDEKHIIVDGKKVRAFAEKEPSKLPWKELKIDVVIESTGRFTDKEGASQHLLAGAKRVIISAPGKGEGIATYLRGVNCGLYKKEDIVIDNASCTTNSAGPIMRVLEQEFGVEKAMLSTIHSYTADQNLQDGPHKDLRRARAAAQNIVPTTTGAAVAVARVTTSLQNKFDGLSFRVPTLTVSLTDLTVLLKRNVTKEEVNIALTTAAKTYLKGILSVTNEELVSSDFIGNPYSAIVDLPLTTVVDGNLLKVVAWYDNEWGYANRLVEMVGIVGKK